MIKFGTAVLNARRVSGLSLKCAPISSSAHVLATIPKSVMLSSLDTVPGLKSTKPLHTISQAITKLHIQPFSFSTTQKVYLVLQCTTKMKTTNNTKNDAKLLGEKKQENSRALDL